jgi:hypothetical protein
MVRVTPLQTLQLLQGVQLLPSSETVQTVGTTLTNDSMVGVGVAGCDVAGYAVTIVAVVAGGAVVAVVGNSTDRRHNPNNQR